MYIKDPLKQVLFLVLLILLLSHNIYAQVTITGTVSCSESKLPIPFATVYVNGTNNGTMTDKNGYYELDNVYELEEIVVSHISYMPIVKQVCTLADSLISFSLEDRIQNVAQVQIAAKNNRIRNIDHFRNSFLGKDKWGSEAIILNDSVLFFKTIENKDSASHSNLFYNNTFVKFDVIADAPLQIDMPSLGYTLHVDLVYYYEEPGKISAFSYNYYKSYSFKNKRDKKTFLMRRNKAYYNSIQHFCRALYTGSLEDQGYGIYYTKESKDSDRAVWERVNIDKNIEILTDDEMAIKGLGDCVFLIAYFYNIKGAPDKVKDRFEYTKCNISSIYLESDSCVLTRNGILTESSIIFGGDLSRKRTGATLPKYYQISK